eukprot:CAMPEP_0180420080 /NCGR_PEP_ID=MMETSP1036_2-20121128/2446_1 /TAXON_ID=632150 /ORGANISM="Azadinium spinosum, Strain 3D9" /LENGTH=147 /DNA_ID=CAMNT_0022425293 /DNA_START=319 /DNA_END=759 /DNA_ORIENTATION=+
MPRPRMVICVVLASRSESKPPPLVQDEVIHVTWPECALHRAISLDPLKVWVFLFHLLQHHLTYVDIHHRVALVDEDFAQVAVAATYVQDLGGNSASKFLLDEWHQLLASLEPLIGVVVPSRSISSIPIRLFPDRGLQQGATPERNAA